MGTVRLLSGTRGSQPARKSCGCEERGAKRMESTEERAASESLGQETQLPHTISVQSHETNHTVTNRTVKGYE